MDIPDCYDPVIQAEQREAEADKHAVRCAWCCDAIVGDGYIWDGDCICEYCCASAIKDNFSVSDIAKALGIGAMTIWQ